MGRDFRIPTPKLIPDFRIRLFQRRIGVRLRGPTSFATMHELVCRNMQQYDNLMPVALHDGVEHANMSLQSSPQAVRSEGLRSREQQAVLRG